MLPSNLTPEEIVRHAEHEGVRPEYVALMEFVVEWMPIVEGWLTSDIAAGFPDEDCLQDLIERIGLFASSLTKVKRDELCAIIEALEERQSELARSAEYVMEELSKLESELAKLED
jgi:hypothetical protein